MRRTSLNLLNTPLVEDVIHPGTEDVIVYSAGTIVGIGVLRTLWNLAIDYVA